MEDISDLEQKAESYISSSDELTFRPLGMTRARIRAVKSGRSALPLSYTFTCDAMVLGIYVTFGYLAVKSIVEYLN